MPKRLYPHKRVRYWLVYETADICALFSDLGLHIQTVRKWVKRGLPTIDNGRPTLIYGNDLIEFIKKQNAKGKCKLELNQFFCMKCSDGRPAFKNKVAMTLKNRMLRVQAKCRECKTNMSKNCKLEDVPVLRKIFVTVDVSELDDCLLSPSKTHLNVQDESISNELQQWSLF